MTAEAWSGGDTPAASITANAGDRRWRRLEVAGPVTLGDQERRPSVLVLTVPYLDLRPSVGEELCDPRKALVGRAMHRCLAVFVDGVHVVAELECKLDGFNRIFLSSGLFLGGGHPTPAAAISGVH